MNPQELYEAYMSVYESDDRREMRRLASQERQAEKKAESEFRNKAGVGAKKSGPKMSTTKLSKKEGEGYAKKTMKDAEYNAKKAKGHTVGNPFPEQVDHFDEVLSEITAAGYSVEQALAYMAYEALTGERYKKVIKKPGGMAYSRMVSADPSKRATRGGRGGESDFGAGDRGSGNKAARRAGTYQEEYVDEAQYARNNPEKYEREQRRSQSSRERRMNDPKTGINSKAFNDFYNAQMSKKKKAS
jgi:hypothetical protein